MDDKGSNRLKEPQVRSFSRLCLVRGKKGTSLCSLQKQAKSPVSGVARRSPPTPDLSRSSGSRAVYFPATAKHARRSHDIASAESRWCSSSKLVLFLACLWPLQAGEKGSCAWEIATWFIL